MPAKIDFALFSNKITFSFIDKIKIEPIAHFFSNA